LSGPGPDFDSLLDAMLDKQIRALVCLESDPFRESRDPARAQAALSHLDLLVAIDHTPTLAARQASLFLPVRNSFEDDGTYVNYEGRAQAFARVLEPGLPLRDASPELHPPRTFSSDTPGSEPWPAWRILARLLGRKEELVTLRREIAAAEPRLAALADTVPGTLGPRLGAGTPPPAASDAELPLAQPDGTLPLLPIPAFAGSGWLASLSPALAPLRPAPQVLLHPDQATALGLHDGDRARLTTHLGHCHVAIRVVAAMAPGTALAPHLPGSALDGLVPGSAPVACRLDREEP
jgi:NADH-quinone oxidoreductase subunit G